MTLAPLPMPLDRRTWLRACLALGLAPLVVPSGDALADFWRARATEDLQRAGELVRAVGVSAGSADLLVGFTGGGDDALARFLAGKVREDFEADRVRWVGPWLLAETECGVLATL